MDAELSVLVRQVVKEGDEVRAPQLAAALARRDGEPRSRLKKLLASVNRKCTIRTAPSLVFCPARNRQVPAHVLDVKYVRNTVARSLYDQSLSARGAWFFAPTSWQIWQSRDLVVVLAVRHHGLVTVGFSVADARSSSTKTEIRAAFCLPAPANMDTLVAWACRFSPDTVTMTVDGARLLVDHPQEKART